MNTDNNNIRTVRKIYACILNAVCNDCNDQHSRLFDFWKITGLFIMLVI